MLARAFGLSGCLPVERMFRRQRRQGSSGVGNVENLRRAQNSGAQTPGPTRDFLHFLKRHEH